MSEELQNEVNAVNSIYGTGTLAETSQPLDYILSLPTYRIKLRLSFPQTYPEVSPSLESIASLGSEFPKGFGNRVLEMAAGIMRELFSQGSVCIYDLIEDLESQLRSYIQLQQTRSSTTNEHSRQVLSDEGSFSRIEQANIPEWAVSEILIEKHSTFVARACSVDSPATAQHAVRYLLSTDKKTTKATHNITAFRIRDRNNSAVTYQDCDDDGEDAAGGRLLHLLHLMDVWNLVVVVSRFYGGVKLGPDRFRLINQAARDAILNWHSTVGQESSVK